MPIRYAVHLGKQGFTLLEFSIVLVIIGLIIGAIMVGKDLIRTAENRAFFSQIEKYNSAVNTFKLKYNCLPGDCANGTSYGFSRNGNGNGFVFAVTSSCDPSINCVFVDGGNPTPAQAPYYVTFAPEDTPVTTYEGDLFWEMLKQANLVTDLTTIGLESGGYPLNFPLMKNSNEWIVVGAWSGTHYYHTGMNALIGSVYTDSCRYSFTPSDVFYIATKSGTTNFTTTSTGGVGMPDAILNGDQLIVVGVDPGCATEPRFYWPPTMGAGGASANVCLNTNTTPPSLNLANDSKQCGLMIKAQF